MAAASTARNRGPFIASLAAMLGLGTPVAAAEDATTASATGEARISVSPDRATLRVAVVTESRKSEDATSANAAKGEAVLEALRAALGREAKIRTVGYSLDPQYDFEKPGGRKLRGYLARNQIEIVTGQLDRVGAAIDAAAEAGANDVDSLTFGLKDDLGVRLRALAEATRRARQKIDSMAGALDLRVERVVSVSEHGAQVIPMDPRVMRAESFAQASTPVEPGTVEVRADVVLVAEIGR